MQTYLVKRVSPVGVANVCAVFLGSIAVVFLFLFIVLGIGSRLVGSGPGLFGPMGFDWFVLLVLPFGYVIMGWLFGIVGAAGYNAYSSVFGGVQVDLAAIEKE